MWLLLIIVIVVCAILFTFRRFYVPYFFNILNLCLNNDWQHCCSLEFSLFIILRLFCRRKIESVFALFHKLKETSRRCFDELDSLFIIVCYKFNLSFRSYVLPLDRQSIRRTKREASSAIVQKKLLFFTTFTREH